MCAARLICKDRAEQLDKVFQFIWGRWGGKIQAITPAVAGIVRDPDNGDPFDHLYSSM
jgi:hypothetical protein